VPDCRSTRRRRALTCEAVLAETAFHLQSVAITLAMLREGLVTIAFACTDHLPQLAALAKRFSDRKRDDSVDLPALN
jgi:hypothetical protein